ncbi:MAG TPA: helix-turn-helix domain-containing protein [Streptosporangiaceae bacterium]|nr:helix-turn-helix domain-containing protein [Streptosporangiaceae bacterium]
MTNSFGELLRSFRVAGSLTQEALAERCRISPATIAAIEQGRRRAPRLSTVRLIAEALDLSDADRELLANAADSAARAAGTAKTAATARAAVEAISPVAGLPLMRTSFVGRAAEQATVLAALRANRMVSLVGSGGVGKTRLAARAAELVAGRFPAGAAFADLVPARKGFVSQAVAALLGVTEEPGLSLDAALHERLARGRTLLVLDNCEHLLDVVAPFAEKLLANCSELTILATSRERLAIPGEVIVAVPPLSRSGEAEALFVDRARASDPAFAEPAEVVSQVCARLDGVPLAIELAAARSASLGIDGLLAGLDDHLRLLAGSRGAQLRHRSLRTVIDWSHDLLDSDERVMFRRVGAFVGSFGLDAVAALVGDTPPGAVADLIGRLADKSLLVHRSGPDGSRWHMLQTIRAYAMDRLAESGEESAIRDAHLRWAARFADALESAIEFTPAWQSAFDQVADDLRAALNAPQRSREVSHQLATSLGHLAYARRFMVEAREHYRTAAALAARPGQAASDLRSAAEVAMASGDAGLAFDLLLAAADQAARAGDVAARTALLGHAVTVADRFAAEFSQEIPHERLRAMLAEAVSICPAGDRTAAAHLAAAAAWTAQQEKTVPDLELASHALGAARLTGDPILISGALDAVVGALDASGRLREAHQVSAERARLLGRLPRHDPRAGVEIIDTYHMVTEIAVTVGDLPAALGFARMAQGDDVVGGQPHRRASKPILPLVLQGNFDEAFALAAKMWQAWIKAGRPVARWMGTAIYGVILGCGLRGDTGGRQEWEARLAELIGASGEPGTNLGAAAMFTTARIALHEGRLDAATEAVAAVPDVGEEPLSWYASPHWYSLRPYGWAVAAEVAVVAGHPRATDRLAAAAPAGAENYWAAACLDRAAGRLYQDAEALRQSVAGWERIDAAFERACTLLLMPARADEGKAALRALGCRLPRS